MAGWEINKGIGRTVEFQGLKAQYLFLFAGGLLGVFILVAVLYMAGIDQLICLCLGFLLATGVIWGTFYLNRVYGRFGIMKLYARKRHPDYLIHRNSPIRLLRRKRSKRIIG